MGLGSGSSQESGEGRGREALARRIQAALDDGRQVAVACMWLTGAADLALAFGAEAATAQVNEVYADLVATFPRREYWLIDGEFVFAVAVRDLDDEGVPSRTAEVVDMMWRLPGLRRMTCRAGWNVGPQDSRSGGSLIGLSQLGARKALEDGSVTRRVTPAESAVARRRRLIVGALPTITDSPDFRLVYQPLLTLATGRIERVEALARWVHPDLGPVRPDEFIQLAELTGAIEKISEVVVDRALAQQAAWRNHDLDLGMSVNLSMLDFRRGDLLLVISEATARHGCPDGGLTVEVTETGGGDEEHASRVLRQLSAIGVRSAIDDFGLGHSTLARLRDLPFDEIKLDRRFVGEMRSSTTDQAIVDAVIRLAGELGLRVTAEGVEDPETLGHLRSAGCDHAQGFLLSKPIHPDDVPAVVEAWSCPEMTLPKR